MSSLEDYKIGNILSSYLDDIIYEAEDGKNSEKKVLYTGFTTFDQMVTLYEKTSTLVGVATYAESGKTGFLLSLLRLLLRQGRKVLFYSTVSTKRQIMNKLMSIYSGVPLEKLGNCSILDPEDVNDIQSASEKLYDSNLYVIDGRPINIDTFIERISKDADEDKIDIVLIDDAEYMASYPCPPHVFDRLREIRIPVIATIDVREISYDMIVEGKFGIRTEPGKPDYTVFIEHCDAEEYEDDMMRLYSAIMYVRNPDDEVRMARLLYNERTMRFENYGRTGTLSMGNAISERDLTIDDEEEENEEN